MTKINLKAQSLLGFRLNTTGVKATVRAGGKPGAYVGTKGWTPPKGA